MTDAPEGMSCFGMVMHGWSVLQVMCLMVRNLSLLELHCRHKTVLQAVSGK